MGNGEAKELIYMTHGHELRWGKDGGRGNTGRRGRKGRKKKDNCNSIINKLYLKKTPIHIMNIHQKSIKKKEQTKSSNTKKPIHTMA